MLATSNSRKVIKSKKLSIKIFLLCNHLDKFAKFKISYILLFHNNFKYLKSLKNKATQIYRKF